MVLKNLILMALDKAERLTDEELMEEIAQLESGEKKLRLRDERSCAVPLNEIILAVFSKRASKAGKSTSA
jgi:hypothetical protein